MRDHNAGSVSIVAKFDLHPVLAPADVSCMSNANICSSMVRMPDMSAASMVWQTLEGAMCVSSCPDSRASQPSLIWDERL